MLFHSQAFLLYFLPIVYLGWLFISRTSNKRAATGWLTVASLFFYAYWNPPYVVLILGSLTTNFLFGKLVDPDRGRHERYRYVSLCVGVTFNLLLLGYFKYANFFVETINSLFSLGWTFGAILLPLGISFFTFQQIAYLVDTFRGRTRGHSFDDYAFFVCFFPQLIAGPIVHHSEILPQVRNRRSFSESGINLFVGLSIFTIGLFKKLALADPCGSIATPFFDAVEGGAQYSSAVAWQGALAYTFQIYFDFSGYSDMCIGLARMFGIRLPENFRAPYRATSIVDFWRRWHITLSRFLRDYLYIPLGGNRHGKLNRYRNLIITMLLGGLWHGAGWTFVIWGGLHGLLISLNHIWTTLVGKHVENSRRSLQFPYAALCWAGTTVSVVAAWVLFRAESLSSAVSILCSMAGIHEKVSSGTVPADRFWQSGLVVPWLSLLALITLIAPTTQSYFRRFNPILERVERSPVRLAWYPGLLHGTVLGVLLILVARRFFSMAPTEFLYFNF